MEYKEVVLEQRAKLNILQEKLAEFVEASFASINRWENGKYKTTKLVKVRLSKLFKKKGIKVER